MISLIQSKSEVFIPYIFDHPNAINWIVRHTYSKSIADMFTLLLKCANDHYQEDPTFTTRKVEIVKGLVNNLKSEREDLKDEFAISIVDICRTLVLIKSYQEVFMNQEVVEQLVNIAQENSKQGSAALSILRFNLLQIKSYIQQLTASKDNQQNKESTSINDEDDVIIDQEENTQDDQAYQAEKEKEIHEKVCSSEIIKQLLTNFVPKTKEYLGAEVSETIDYQYRSQNRVFGRYRLAVVQLLDTLVDLGIEQIHTNIIASGVFETLFNLFFEFPMVSFLHNSIHSMFATIMASTNENIKLNFLEQTKILTTLPDTHERNGTFNYESARTIRSGFAAFNVIFAKQINSLSESSADLKAKLDENDSWRSFCDEDVKTQDELNNLPLDNKVKQNQDENTSDDDSMIKDIFARFSMPERKEEEKEDDDDREQIVDNLCPNLDNEQEEEDEEEETSVDSNYHSNTYWQSSPQHSIDELLKEFSG